MFQFFFLNILTNLFYHSILCHQIISSLLTANTPIFQGAKCTTVIFIRITIVIRGKRQVVNGVTNNNTSTDGVQGNATIELQTLPGSQLSQEQFTQLLNDGHNQFNKTSSVFLNNLESTRKCFSYHFNNFIVLTNVPFLQFTLLVPLI